MQKSKRALPWQRGIAVFSICLFSHATLANAACQSIGHFTSLQSTVEIQANGGSGWQTAKLDDRLCQGDTIRVGVHSRAAVQLVNNAVLRIDQNTTMRLLNVSGDAKKRSLLQLIKGVFQTFIRKPHHMMVQTPYLNGMIEGTEFLVSADAKQSSILLLAGKIVAVNKQGSVTIHPGEEAVAQKGQAPKTVVIVKPENAVQWALHYPVLFQFNPSDYPAGAIRQSVQAYNAGDLNKAFSDIKGITAKQAGFFVYRAALYLSVGRVGSARQDLQQALSLSPNDSDALALQAVIAVAQNQNQQAMSKATAATKADPKSATALIALSYAQQSAFDLKGARASLQQAVKLAPKNALAWARLAEIDSAFRQLSASEQAAQKAVAINPNLSRTQTVLGFVDLTRVSLAKAMAAFRKAIALDHTDPLPRLGLGLALIGDGQLQKGREEVDVAASLDPNQSIIRSYLGKAYYAEKRDGLAQQQFHIAEQLDPKDPTPWFYEAIAKQTQNQPVTALRDINKAIALNGNRAVYRSRLLLDSDLAARSASQGRIYNDLGFQPLALQEGWQSVNIDPTNYSAHRLLADSYSALPNHEIARVSELLQAQLLQPLNLTPIQPQSAESDLYLISSGGAGSVGFNEYNPLFYHDGTTAQFSGLVAGNETSSEEAVVAGVHHNLSYSIGGYHFQTNGFRPNAFQKEDLANAFVQMAVSPQTSVQAEYRYKNALSGDTQMRFFPNEYYPNLTTPDNTRTLRLGMRHNLSPNSTVLGSFVYMKAKGGPTQNPLPASVLSLFNDSPQKNLSGELEYLYRSSDYNLVAGIGQFNRTGTSHNVVILNNPAPPPATITLQDTTNDIDLKHSNVYAYSNIHALSNLTLILGLSAEFSGNTTSSASKTANDRNQYNPKFGLMWSPAKGTLVRLAAFRTMKRPVIANQTLEPTQVAGFNQFYDDVNNTISRHYGAAVDQTFSPNLHGGLEVSNRDLDVPVNGQIPGTATYVYYISNWRDDRNRAYLFWTPASWLGLKAEYRYEHIRRSDNLTDGVKNASTTQLLLGMSIFNPSGWSLSLEPTYYDQRGTFESIITPPGNFQNGNDSFWVVNAALKYRLPRRQGFITAGVKNMFKKDFLYFDTNANNPTLQPGRTFFLSATLSLP